MSEVRVRENERKRVCVEKWVQKPVTKPILSVVRVAIFVLPSDLSSNCKVEDDCAMLGENQVGGWLIELGILKEMVSGRDEMQSSYCTIIGISNLIIFAE